MARAIAITIYLLKMQRYTGLLKKSNIYAKFIIKYIKKNIDNFYYFNIIKMLIFINICKIVKIFFPKNIKS